MKGLKFLESPVINEKTIALETILDVGFGKKSYLDTQHTLENFRSSLWDPEFFRRDGRTVENEETILKVDSIVLAIS